MSLLLFCVCLGSEPSEREYRNQMEITLCSVIEKAVLNVAKTVTIGSANTFSLSRLPYSATSSLGNQRASLLSRESA